MPESCRDRPTSAHEHVFLLTKSGGATFWTHRDHAGSCTQPTPDYRWVHKGTGYEMNVMPGDWDTHEHVRKIWKRINLWRGHDYFYDIDAVREPLAAKTYTTFGCEHRPQGNDAAGNVKSDNWGSSLAVRKPKLNGAGEIAGANLRNVWEIATEAFPEAHFATYPTALVERCILAGTSERGCCAGCGAPWARVANVSYQKLTGSSGCNDGTGSNNWDGGGYPRMAKETITTGWQATCQCGPMAPTVPCTVLDPFMGAGTTCLEADRLQRDAIGIELNAAYVEMARGRIVDDAPLLAEVAD